MKSIIFLAFAAFFSVNVIAQNVGIGTATPTARCTSRAQQTLHN